VALKELSTRVAVLTALRDAIDVVIDSERVVLTSELIDANQTLGVKQLDITLPNGEKVASASIGNSEPKPLVTNEAAFVRWVAENFPTEIIQTVRPTFKKVLFENTEQVNPQGEAVHTKTGEIIDGVVFSNPSSRLTLRFKKDGRELVAEAFNRGELEQVIRPLFSLPVELKSVEYLPDENLGDSITSIETFEPEPSGALGG
jgi:hypothetical protein